MRRRLLRGDKHKASAVEGVVCLRMRLTCNSSPCRLKLDNESELTYRRNNPEAC